MKSYFNRRSAIFLLVILIGGWLLYHRQQIHNVSDAWRLAAQQWSDLTAAADGSWLTVSTGDPTATDRNPGTIRIASFNLHHYGNAKARRSHVLDYYTKIIRQFDLVAIQGIRTDDTNVIAQLIDTVNRQGGHYAIMTSPRQGRTRAKQQYAFIFDTRRVQSLGRPYVVADPEDLLQRPPFVGWFRTVGVPEQQAFTFSLVNCHIDMDMAEEEWRYMVNLLRAVRQDGRREDDVILTGTLYAGDDELTPLLAGSGWNWLIRDQTTLTEGIGAADNFILDPQATVEFTGRSGVLDFLRQYNLNVSQALEVSEHLPVWAEFFVEEGRSSGLVAQESAAAIR